MSIAAIEDALQAWVRAKGYGASAPPVPANLGATLPWVCITRTGGSNQSLVSDNHYISFDVYDTHWSQACSAAEKLAALLCVEQQLIDGVVVYGVPTLTSPPFPNPDPDHSDLSCYTFNVELHARRSR